MMQIALVSGDIASVDDDDFNTLNKFRWHRLKNGKTIYATRKKCDQNGIWKNEYMHHMILSPTGKHEIDHIDGNGLNNQKSNLRFVTHRQNLQNRHPDQKLSRFPGVTWCKRDKKWKAQIRFLGKNKHLGNFKDELEAATAYRVACKVLTGELLC